mmetsp:Transcript_1086/g.4410  ORF Transcript_1086/g.4410 Transcript_1086/m.4410 type:complete len:324 (+) Transcript_1086:235-1206(+)
MPLPRERDAANAPQNALPHPVSSTTRAATLGHSNPSSRPASYAIAPDSPRRRHTTSAPASAIRRTSSVGDSRSPSTKSDRASRSFGEKTSAAPHSARSSEASRGTRATVKGSTDVSPHPAARSAAQSETSGRDGSTPKCAHLAAAAFSGQLECAGRSMAYSSSLRRSSRRHTCVRLPSRSVICHARGVGMRGVGMSPRTSTPWSTSHSTHSRGQSPSPPIPATRPRVSGGDLLAKPAPKSVCGPPPPSTAIRVVPSWNTRSSTMRVVLTTSRGGGEARAGGWADARATARRPCRCGGCARRDGPVEADAIRRLTPPDHAPRSV